MRQLSKSLAIRLLRIHRPRHQTYPQCSFLTAFCFLTFTPGALDKLSSQTLDGLGFLVVPLIKPRYHFLFEQDQQVGPAGSGGGGMGLSPTHLHGHSCMVNAIFTQNVISRLKLETSHSQICFWPT